MARDGWKVLREKRLGSREWWCIVLHSFAARVPRNETKKELYEELFSVASLDRNPKATNLRVRDN